MGFMEGATEMEVQGNEEERRWVEERAAFMAAGLKYSHRTAQLFVIQTRTQSQTIQIIIMRAAGLV